MQAFAIERGGRRSRRQWRQELRRRPSAPISNTLRRRRSPPMRARPLAAKATKPSAGPMGDKELPLRLNAGGNRAESHCGIYALTNERALIHDGGWESTKPDNRDTLHGVVFRKTLSVGSGGERTQIFLMISTRSPSGVSSNTSGGGSGPIKRSPTRYIIIRRNTSSCLTCPRAMRGTIAAGAGTRRRRRHR